MFCVASIQRRSPEQGTNNFLHDKEIQTTDPILASTYPSHYRNPGLCRVLQALPSAFCRALGKEAFAESRTWQSLALGNELVYRVRDTRHKNTLGKESFVECLTLGEGGSRQRVVSGRLKLTTVNLYRGPSVGTRQRGFFAECQPTDTR